MKTHTAPWDYKQQFSGVAPYNGKCILCGHDCYTNQVPDGTLYTCPNCESYTVIDPRTPEQIERDRLSADEQYTKEINRAP